MIKIQYRLSLLISIALLLTLLLASEPVYAQWPPFWFNLIPSYDNGQITYRITFSSRVDWRMNDVAFKIPLPEGTRFLEANAQPSTSTDFDGEEITFFTSALRHESIRDAYFIVEVTDPTKMVFTTRTWIAWQGDQPGDYLTNNVSIDITRPTLNWEPPPRSRLQLEISAAVVDDIITYTIYPKNVGGLRMWDLKINVPLPEGTTFLAAEAPPPFVANFDGQEVSFSILELEKWTEVEPPSFQVSAEEVTEPFLITHAWAVWKNSGSSVTRKVALEEQVRSGDIVVQPHTSQQVVSDIMGDVPLPNYDLTSIAIQQNSTGFEIIFYTAGEMGPVGRSLEYILFIDSDCRTGTGLWRNYRGVEYRVGYDHKKGRAVVNSWDETVKKWGASTVVEASSPPGGNMVIVRVPYGLLETGQQFCWVGEVNNRIGIYSQNLPREKVPNYKHLSLTRYQAVASIDVTETAIVRPSAGTFVETGDVWQYWPGWSEPPADWKSIDFDDSDWFSGPTGIGYGAGKYATDLSQVTQPLHDNDMSLMVSQTITESGMVLAVLPSGDYGSVFIRRTFIVPDPTSLTELTLEMKYEGGFVAYLNGVEVARQGLGQPGEPVFYDTLAADREAGTSTGVIDLSPYITDFVAGTNLLAVQVHRSEGSANLSVTPQMAWANNPVPITPLDKAEASVTVPVPTPAEAPSITDISGKLAVPIDNGQVVYDLYVFSMPDGQELVKIPNARQPNFRFDGQRMLINREGGGVENVFEYNLVDGTEKQVSDAPQDWHPFYDPWGNRVVYGNSELTSGSPKWIIEDGVPRLAKTVRKPFIFVQCSLLPPHQEVDSRCQNLPWLGVLVPAGQTGEIQGTHPVWTSNDMIAYKGCNTWAGSSLCGIYIVSSTSTKGFSDGFIPRQLTRDTSDAPSDTKGNLIAFTSQRDGNWEAYVMDLNGAGVKNLSNSPGSNDGLPAISPDGNWVAFVSDRDGQWAVWVVPIVGGEAQKLFDLPAAILWGDGKRAWTNERISWGP